LRGEAHGFVRVVHEEDWDHACSAGFGKTFSIVGDVQGLGWVGGDLQLDTHGFELGKGRRHVFVGSFGVAEAGWFEEDGFNRPH
jgi:hypothetical protein